MKDLNIYFILSNIIFISGLLGFLFNPTLIHWFINLELMFLGIILNFILIAINLMDTQGYVISLYIIIIAAVETIIGLSLTIILYKKNTTIIKHKKLKHNDE